jgi:hypothetical protein
MGMDISGKNPTGDAGVYFRNNVWWWRPLWDYCYEIASDLISKDLHHTGHCNDGTGLNDEDSKTLAKRLNEEIKSGKCLEYQKQYEQYVANIPDEECFICHGAGDRPGSVVYINPETNEKIEPWIGEKHLPAKELEGMKRTFTDKWAETCNGCNACSGKGSKRPLDAEYPFSVENVTNFVEFLEHCGGFEGW